MPILTEGISVDIGRSIDAQVQAKLRSDWPVKLREAVARGFDREPVVITDGVVHRNPDLVVPYGRIEFVARVDLADLVFWINAELYRRSPVGPEEGGHYRNDHTLLINGNAVAGNWRVALQRLRGGDRIQLVNPRPYARKLEAAGGSEKEGRRARKGRRGSSRQAPNGIYRPVVAAIVQKWGKSVFAELKYVQLNLGVKVWGDIGGRYRKLGKGRGAKWVKVGHVQRVLRDQVYPCISIFVKPSQVM